MFGGFRQCVYLCHLLAAGINEIFSEIEATQKFILENRIKETSHISISGWLVSES